MNLLIRSPTQMYIYLPSFRKVRRVASHVQEQGFMGSAFDHAEVSLATYSDTFTVSATAVIIFWYRRSSLSEASNLAVPP